MDKLMHMVQEHTARCTVVKTRVSVAARLMLCVSLAWSPVFAHTAMAASHASVRKAIVEVPAISAEAASLIDVDTGRILFERDANKRMRIASLTKIITAWIAVRSGKMNQVVTVSDHAVRQEGSSIYLGRGEQQTLRALTYGMMLRSGNDAATAIAESLAGSTKQFADVMNKEARALGLQNSHFANPHGLDDPMHYSSAHDMAVISAHALRNPVFRQIVATKYYTIPWPTQQWDRKMKNKNKLLWMLPGADGIKTGYTKKAGRCLASSATKQGHQVALIVLRDANDWVDSARLLSYGLTAYDRADLVSRVPLTVRAPVRFGVNKTVALRAVGSAVYPLRPGEMAMVKMRVTGVKRLMAPVRQGELAGMVEYVLSDHVIGRAKLETAEQVPMKGWMGRFRELFE